MFISKSSRPTMDPRQFQMLVMMAQSQPMFLAMMGMEGKLRSELEKREKLRDMQDLTAEAKLQNDKKLWQMWLQRYEEALHEQMEKILER